MKSSRIYVEDIIYDENGNFESPTKMIDLYRVIQTLVYLYRENPEWEENFKQDIMQYVKECIDLLEKM